MSLKGFYTFIYGFLPHQLYCQSFDATFRINQMTQMCYTKKLED